MGKVFESIDAPLRRWIERQKLFFVATAPSALDGLVNCSPKGGDSFRVLDDRRVAYQDYTGSGIETVAHLRDNGRIVIMFCAFEGPPKILRLHGRGRVLSPGDAEYDALLEHFPPNPGTRAIILVEVSRIGDSCGYAVPRYQHQGPRDGLDRWAEDQGADGLVDYRREKNQQSLDGLPGLDDGADRGDDSKI